MINPADQNVKQALCDELSDLMAKWNALGTQISHTQRDVMRLSARIREICRLLDKFDAEHAGGK